MPDRQIKDNFAVDSSSIGVEAEKRRTGPAFVRLMVPGDNMRGYHGRALSVDNARSLVDRILQAINWLESGDETKQF